MAKIKKTRYLSVPSDARTGDFRVLKPAVKSGRFTLAQIRAAVRKVNKEQAAKGK